MNSHKNKQHLPNMIENLAFQLANSTKLEEEDIEVCISVLTEKEKAELKRILPNYKKQNDYSTNKKVYKAIYIILTVSNIKEKFLKQK